MKAMTDRFHFLPDPETLDALLRSAGVGRRQVTGDTATLLPHAGPVASPLASAVALAAHASPAAASASDGAPLLVGGATPSLRQILGAAPHEVPIDRRLEAMLQWLIGNTGAFAAYIADIDGLPLANRHAPDSYVAATASLAQAHQEMARFVPSPVDGTTSIEIHDQNILEVIWAQTSAGRLALGLVLAAPLERTVAITARRMLKWAVDPEHEGVG